MIELSVGPNQSGNVEFAQIMRRYRNRRHWSRAKIAEKAGISSEYVRSIEGGFRTPAKEMAARLLDVFSVTYFVEENALIFDDYVVTFTSRIQSAREPNKPKQKEKDETIYKIVIEIRITKE